LHAAAGAAAVVIPFQLMYYGFILLQHPEDHISGSGSKVASRWRTVHAACATPDWYMVVFCLESLPPSTVYVFLQPGLVQLVLYLCIGLCSVWRL
jgi:hypothetical protein